MEKILTVGFLTYGDVILIIIAAGMGILTRKIWGERNNQPKNEAKGSRPVLIIVVIVFMFVIFGFLALSVKNLLDPLNYSIAENYGTARLLGYVHNWAWALVSLSVSVLIIFLVIQLIKTWFTWKNRRLENSQKSFNNSGNSIKTQNKDYKTSPEDHRKYMPK